ncbi:protein of unknown function [Clostridium beijerinckii]|nr:protein of unknown function [Clostridium beijerinckii]
MNMNEQNKLFSSVLVSIVDKLANLKLLPLVNCKDFTKLNSINVLNTFNLINNFKI